MSSGTILIADDDRVFTELFSTKLRAKGFKVLAAFDAMQAVMIANKSIPDAILIDVKMPGGTGLEAIRQIKISTKTCGIPIIAVSALEDPSLPEKIKDMGAVGFRVNPILR